MIIHDNLATFVNDKLLKIPGDGLWLLQGLLDSPLDSSAVLFGLLTLWGVRISLLSLRTVVLFGLLYAFDWNRLLFFQKPEDGMCYLTVVCSLSKQGAQKHHRTNQDENRFFGILSRVTILGTHLEQLSRINQKIMLFLSCVFHLKTKIILQCLMIVPGYIGCLFS